MIKVQDGGCPIMHPPPCVRQASVVLWLLQTLDDARRTAHSHRVGRDVAGDDCARTDHAASPYRHAGEQYRPAANPHLVLDSDGFGVGAAPKCGVGMAAEVALGGVGRMGSSVNFHVRSYQHTVAYVDAVVVDKGAIHVDNHVVAHMDVLAVLAMEVNVHMNGVSHTPKQLPEQLPLRLLIGVVAAVQKPQQPLGTQREAHRGLVAREDLAGHTFL